MSHYPDADYLTGAYQPGQFYPDEGAEVAFAGRSNAGKSSAINVIVNRNNFARVSKSPGRTQLINFFVLRNSGGGAGGTGQQRIVDLPGYGFAKVTREMQQHWQQLTGAYFEGRRSLAGLFVIVDIRRGLGDYDRQMLEWARVLDCPAHVLLTKADKLKRGAAKNRLLQVRREISSLQGDIADDKIAAASVQLFSALKRDGAEAARTALDGMLGANN